MTNTIESTITNGNTDRSYQSARRLLVILAMATVPGWAQSSFQSLPPVNAIAMNAGINNFTPPSAILAHRSPEPAAVASVTLPSAIASPAHSNAKKWWVISGIALTAASLVDFGTSMGHNEANPALQNSTGQFSAARGLSLKLGLAGATMLFQALIARHRPELYGPCAVINTFGAGAFGAVAVHNANTPR